MENIGLNNEVEVAGKSFHVQTQYLEPGEKVVSNIFDNGKVIFSKAIELKDEKSTSEIKSQVNRLHQNMISDLELVFYISEKVQTIRHAASNNKLGIVFLKRNLFDEAVAEFKKAVEIDPDYVDAYNNLGYVFLKQKKYEAAIEAFSKGIEKDGTYADLHNNLGYAYFCISKYGDAIVELKRALEINTEYIHAIFNLCLTQLKSTLEDVPDPNLGSTADRIKNVKELLNTVKINELFSKPEYIDKILDHIENNQFSEAIKTLEKAEQEIPLYLDKYLESEFYLKFMFGGKGKDDNFILEYIDELKRAVGKYPNYADIRNNLGIGYLIRCRNLFLNALEEFRLALKINPEFKKAEKNLKLAENDGKGFLILLRAILK